MLTLDNPTIDHFKDKIEFSVYVETYAITHGVSLMESLLQYCEDADVNIDQCAKMLCDSLKNKLEEEAIEDKYMVRRSTILSFFE